MTKNLLIIAITSRALFDFSEENLVYEQQGLAAYKSYQREHEHTPLKPGACFSLVKKLLSLNTDPKRPLVDVILCSRNSADSGLRVFNSIDHYGLSITRAFFSDGQPVHLYLKAYNVQLFLSANATDVISALSLGIASATMLPVSKSVALRTSSDTNYQLRFAFDADCVLFSDAIERINQQYGLDAFAKNEKENAHVALPEGPFSGFLRTFGQLQSSLPDASIIRTALVTARSAPAHERVIRTLRLWNVTIDESFFLGGYDKSSILSVYQPDIFFDDLRANCDQSSQQVPTGHVPYGITNAQHSTESSD